MYKCFILIKKTVFKLCCILTFDSVTPFPSFPVPFSIPVLLLHPLYAESRLKKSNTTLVGPSPAPGSWMHRLRRSMPLWRLRNSASLAGGLVGALHVFLCVFHAAFWHSALQK